MIACVCLVNAWPFTSFWKQMISISFKLNILTVWIRMGLNLTNNENGCFCCFFFTLLPLFSSPFLLLLPTPFFFGSVLSVEIRFHLWLALSFSLQILFIHFLFFFLFENSSALFFTEPFFFLLDNKVWSMTNDSVCWLLKYYFYFSDPWKRNFLFELFFFFFFFRRE